jgi:predicted ATPase/class 3 adenylate cyclase
MRCSKCGAENRQGRKFCAECAAPLVATCTKCGAANEPSEKFCGECGAALSRSAGPAIAQPLHPPSDATSIRITSEPTDLPKASDLDGERKTVSALFADLKGSTELIHDLDPEVARAIVDPALKVMVEAVRHFDGYVVQSTGDGIFALFGAPLAHEDHPQRALYAALRMQEGLRQHAERLNKERKPPIQARVGVNSGEVVMRTVETGGRVEYTPVGYVTNLAARLQTAAPAGGIAISEETRRLVEGYFELRALGPTAIKGVPEPANVYEVTGPGPLRTHFQLSARRGLTKFVGRDEELAQLRRAFELARSGRGQLVAIVAEAGTGKSRLVYEFKARLPPHCKVFEAYSVSHGKASAWLPVLELLRTYFKIVHTDDASSRREKIRTALTALDPSLDDALPYMFGLLGIVEGPDPLDQMDPQTKRQRTLEAIRRIVLSESVKQPIILIFEDLHWIDSQTQMLLDLLADGLARTRILLLVNYRPEYRHEWTNKSYYSQLRLDSLGSADGAAMLAALLGESVELVSLKQLIAERTGGNPFFIEEIVQSLFDEGALIRNGVVKMTGPPSQMRLPPTVQGLLASRIDRQPAEHKQLLQTLAVIGRESTLRLISKVASQADRQLMITLGDLQAAEFVYHQTAGNDAVYVFKHALTQEVAYNSLLVERRKQLHERVGQAIEAAFANQLDDQVSRLAYHYSHSNNADKTIEYLGRAGRQSVERSAHADAIEALTAAIDLLLTFPDSPERMRRELPLQMALGQALIPVKFWASPEVGRAFERAQVICQQLGDAQELFPALFGLLSVHLVRGQVRPAREIGFELLRRAQTAGTPALLVMAHYALGVVLYYAGELILAREHQEAMLEVYDEERDLPLSSLLGSDPKCQCLSHNGLTLWHLGFADQAVEQCYEAVVRGRKHPNPNSTAAAQYFLNVIHLARGDTHAFQDGAESVIEFCTKHGLAGWPLFTRADLGRTLALQGRYEEGLAQVLQFVQVQQAIGFNLGRPPELYGLAEVYQAGGRIEEALATLTEALQAVELQEEHIWEAEIYRLKGELLLKKHAGNLAEAQGCFERAIEIASSHSQKSLELHATTSVARLFLRQGRRDEARAMLTQIYGRFTEGFDTTYLTEAKALLDELSC